MTAEQRIKTGGRELENIGFRGLGFETYSGPEVNAKAIASLLEKAEEFIFILGDCLTPYFYRDEAIQDSIAKALKKGVNIIIASGPEPNMESINTLKSNAQQFNETGGKITLYILKQSPTMHFEVVDRKHVRIERPHSPATIERNSVIRLNQEGVARELENVFAECISRAVSHEVL